MSSAARAGAGTSSGAKGGAVVKDSHVPADTHTKSEPSPRLSSDDRYDPDIIG